MADGVIANLDNLPDFGAVLTADKKELALSRDLQKRVAVICLLPEDQKQVAVLWAENASSFEKASTKHQCEAAGYRVKMHLNVEAGVLVDVYAGEHKKHDATNGDWEPENEDYFQCFDSWATAGVRQQASDIHVEVREDRAKIRLRIDGIMYQHTTIDATLAMKTVMAAYAFLADPLTRSSETFDKADERNCMIARTIDDKAYRFRFESYPVLGGLDCTMRIISVEASDEIPTLQELGFAPSQVQELLEMMQRKGCVLICGIPGSGKSTTAMSQIETAPDKESKKIISIEDPVERRNPCMSQISVRRRGGTKNNAADADTAAFAEAARTLLRGDLDMCFIGEIRDSDVGAITTSLTQAGAKVLATLHTGCALDAIPRLASEQIGMSRQFLGGRNSIAGIIYQALLPLLCDHCKLPASKVLDRDYLDLIQTEFEVDVANMHVAGPGCPHCGGRGKKGRTVAAETVRLDDYMRKNIRHGFDAEAVEYWLKQREAGFDKENMRGKTAFEHGLFNVLNGRVDPRDLEKEFEPFKTYRLQKTELYINNSGPSTTFPRLAAGGEK